MKHRCLSLSVTGKAVSWQDDNKQQIITSSATLGKEHLPVDQA